MAARKKRAKKRGSSGTRAQPGGEVFERRYKGKLHKVVLTPNGYRYAGKDYGSSPDVCLNSLGIVEEVGP